MTFRIFAMKSPVRKREKNKGIDEAFNKAVQEVLKLHGISENWGIWFSAIGKELSQRSAANSNSNQDPDFDKNQEKALETTGVQQDLFD
ncbi:MAG: hypothetical protein BRC22_01030 [Parcubacteria group bacterium QH_9_35_7]|nr:MAG: hypothetical protein BRC22_01030 [Parcubacteria group bacterium QH_9_35_7]